MAELVALARSPPAPVPIQPLSWEQWRAAELSSGRVWRVVHLRPLPTKPVGRVATDEVFADADGYWRQLAAARPRTPPVVTADRPPSLSVRLPDGAQFYLASPAPEDKWTQVDWPPAEETEIPGFALSRLGRVVFPRFKRMRVLGAGTTGPVRSASSGQQGRTAERPPTGDSFPTGSSSSAAPAASLYFVPALNRLRSPLSDPPQS